MDFVSRQGMDDELAALTADDAAKPAEEPRDEDDEDGPTAT
jgi:hypothetical protein